MNDDADATYAVLWNRDAAVEALNERRIELELSMVDLDEAAGHAPGTAAKYLGPSQVKGLGVGSLFKIARSLGLRIVLEVDQRAAAAILEERRRPRQHRQARMQNLAQKCGRRTMQRALRHMATKLSWNEAQAAVAEARATAAAVAAQKAAVAAEKAERAAALKGAVKTNGQPPASSERRRGARQQNGNGAASAYDAPIGDELEQIAEDCTIVIKRSADETRGRKRNTLAPTPFFDGRKTGYLTRRAKAATAAR